MYKNSAKILVGRIILEFFLKFKWLKSVIPTHIPHIYGKEMVQKSTIMSLPLLNSNEAKYQDCVNILRSYEKWIAEIYVKAGLLDDEPHVDNPQVPHGPAAPGQTYSHREDSPDDPMREMKIAFAGDQLTRVRFAGAKDLLSGSHTPSDQTKPSDQSARCAKQLMASRKLKTNLTLLLVFTQLLSSTPLESRSKMKRRWLLILFNWIISEGYLEDAMIAFQKLKGVP